MCTQYFRVVGMEVTLERSPCFVQPVVRQAKEAEGADNAVMLLTHLTTFIMMLQDELVRA